MKMSNLLRSLLIGILLFVATGCQLLFSDVTKVDLRIIAGGDLNLDDAGRPSPLVIRLIELKSPMGFENANFFSLYQHEKETLSDEWVSSEELELKPGDVHELKFSLKPESQVVAVLAAYRQLNDVTWRVILPVQRHKHNAMTLLLNSKGMALASSR